MFGASSEVTITTTFQSITPLFLKRLLKPGGINIPYEYTSFLEPISHPILHNKVTKAHELSWKTNLKYTHIAEK